MAKSLFIESCRQGSVYKMDDDRYAALQRLVQEKPAFNRPADVDAVVRKRAQVAMYRSYRWIFERGDWDLVDPNVITALRSLNKVRNFLYTGETVSVLPLAALTLVERCHEEHDWRNKNVNDKRAILLKDLEAINRFQPSPPMDGYHGHEANISRNHVLERLAKQASVYGLEVKQVGLWEGGVEVFLVDDKGNEYKTSDWKKFTDL